MILLWGSNARETHPIFFHHVLKGVRSGARLYADRPAPDQLRRSGPTCGSASTSAPTSRWPTPWRARSSHAGLENRAFIEHATTGFEAYRAAVEPYTLERAEAVTGVPGRRHPRAGARLRPRRPRPDLLDARHHRAPQRRRQRARAHQPGAAHRPRRPLRLGPQPAARPEQRAGRRRHGRASRTGCPASRTSRTTSCAREVRARLGRARSRRRRAGT